MSSEKNHRVALHCENVSFSYRAHEAVRGALLELREGEFLGLVGPNGSGKSTLLQIATGYLHPGAGGVTLFGKDIARLSRREIAGSIAYIPQKSDPAFPFTVLQMALMGRHPYAGLGAFDTDEDIQIARESLAGAGIAELAPRMYNELSGGEQQLVLLARALAQRTPVIVLDEPASFLDMRRQWEIMNRLAEQRERGATILATFHDLGLAARWCDRVALMDRGRIAACGTPREVLTGENLAGVYSLGLRVETNSAGHLTVDFPA